MPEHAFDGRRFFATEEDEAREDSTARLVAAAFGCELRRYAPLCPIDFYAVRDGALVGHLELKVRKCASSTYATVFLSVRKWLALTLAQTGLGVPSLFVVRFREDDVTRWIRVSDVDPTQVWIAGDRRSQVPHPTRDIEPLITVPVDAMTALEGVA